MNKGNIMMVIGMFVVMSLAIGSIVSKEDIEYSPKVILLGSIFAILILSILTLPIWNRYLPIWACKKMGWHLKPTKIDNDGCSDNGNCPRCNKHVMQDSQGNWF